MDSAMDEDREKLERAIAGLPAIEREVLLMSAADGLAADEIAARLGIPAGRVRRHLARALCRVDLVLAPPRRPWWRFW